MFKDKSTDSQFSEYKTEDQIILINELDPQETRDIKNQTAIESTQNPF